MSGLSIIISSSVIEGVSKVIRETVKEVIRESIIDCSKRYNFDESEAIRCALLRIEGIDG